MKTKATSCRRIFPKDLNDHQTMFGGEILALIDEVGSLSAQKVTNGEIVTGSISNVTFIKPIVLGETLTVNSFVSGVGQRSIEVFTYGVSENMSSKEQKFVFQSFEIFVASSGSNVEAVNADSTLAKTVMSGYNERKTAIKTFRPTEDFAKIMEQRDDE